MNTHRRISVPAESGAVNPESEVRHTGVLPDRAHFRAQLETRRSSRCGGSALFVVDIDGFRDIADRFGQETGQAILDRVSAGIAGLLRHSDFAARMEADEFHLYIDGLLSRDAAVSFASRLNESLCGVWSVRGTDHYLSVSIGIVYAGKGEMPADIQRKGSAALRRAKERGRGSVCLYEDGLDEDLCRRLQLEAALHHAIGNDELYLSYQPIVEARTGRLASVEALVRWNSSLFGKVPPSEFIPAAEESGMIVQIGNRVIEEVFAQKRRWEDAGLTEFSVAINLSPVQLRHDEIVGFIRNCALQNGISHASVEFEVTESVSLPSSAGSLERLDRLRKDGFQVSLDDFGTGYSSLSRLKTMPVDTIKIDKSFIDDIGVSQCSEAIISGVIHLSHRMNLRVVAEGVETVEQAHFLTDAGADLLQGYHFSRPLAAADLDVRLRLGAISAGSDSCSYYHI